MRKVTYPNKADNLRFLKRNPYNFLTTFEPEIFSQCQLR